MQLILGLEACVLTPADIQRITHPAVAGVVLFKRNYESPEQLLALTKSIRQVRADLFISIDHEGGRVQRLREGFTILPSGRQILNQYRLSPSKGIAIAEAVGIVMSIELQQHGIDLSYAPVLDVDFGLSEVIGDRSYGSLTQEIIILAGAVMRGMRSTGMATVGKHFPGHGGVVADTHGEIAVDHRALSYLWQADLQPFKHLVHQGLEAIMPAHVIYPDVDDKPAGFSEIWLQDILRKQLDFHGLIISDDLDMAGSDAVGNLKTKLFLASAAGCDLALICNNLDAMDEALSLEAQYFDPEILANTTTVFGKFCQNIPSQWIDSLPTYRARIAQAFS
ncbi:MAG: bglX [Gammaproteobacteria bacterium]|jgi:beta-N-acetylhexosaminidase|nr:bglX [Gammaproteobacteria bacterium]